MEGVNWYFRSPDTEVIFVSGYISYLSTTRLHGRYRVWSWLVLLSQGLRWRSQTTTYFTCEAKRMNQNFRRYVLVIFDDEYAVYKRKTETSSIYWDQLSRLHLKTEIEPSLWNTVSPEIKSSSVYWVQLCRVHLKSEMESSIRNIVSPETESGCIFWIQVSRVHLKAVTQCSVQNVVLNKREDGGNCLDMYKMHSWNIDHAAF
jgi:hypothetical protein